MLLKDKLRVLILLLLVILPMIATDIYLPVIPSIDLELGGVGSNITGTLTSYMFGYSLSLLSAGILADIFGRRIISIVGLVIFIVSSIGCFFVSSIEQLMIWRFFQALGGGCGTLIARIIVRDVFDQKSQVRVLSYLATGLVISPILGPIIGAYISNYLGWRSIFLALSFFSLVTLMLVYVCMKESLVNKVHRKNLKISALLSQCLDLLRHREFIFNTLVISFAWAIYFTFASSSSLLIQRLYLIDPIEYSFIFSTTICGFIFGTIFIRWRIKNSNLRLLIALAGLIILASTLILYILSLGNAGSLWVNLTLVFFALFGIGIIFPATQAGVMMPFQNNIGLISGLFYSIEMLFGAIFGLILSYIGFTSWTLISFVMLTAASCIVLLTYWDKCYSQNLDTGIFKSYFK
jgi:DHA1 family bicyclomycin/chloramphenicol resistance-like MFS transporter